MGANPVSADPSELMVDVETPDGRTLAIDDPVLMEMARIMQAADIKGQLDDHPAARGLQLVSRGFPQVTSNIMRLPSARGSFTTRSTRASSRIKPLGN